MATRVPLPFAGDPFGNMKAGEERTYGSFEATQSGTPQAGMQVVRGTPNPIGTMQTLMTQGASMQDAIKAVTMASDVNLNRVRTKQLPRESEATIAKMGAETGLLGQQAKFYKPKALADVANTLADTSLRLRQGQAIERDLREYVATPDSIDKAKAGFKFHAAAPWWGGD